MKTNRLEQSEALETLTRFNDRLLKNLPTITEELSGKRQPDTDTYLKSIIDAINWEVTVMNATSDLLAEGKTIIDREGFNQSILALNTALSSGTDSDTAAAFRNLIPYFESLGIAAREVTT